jgi:multisubunit Na+/H+ antiporter MnhE subunit
VKGLPGFAVLCVLCCALEVALVGKIDPQETPVGLIVGLVTAVAVAAAARAGGERYGFRLVWLGVVPRIMLHVVRDTVRLFAILVRRLCGGPLPGDRIVEIPFDPGDDDAESHTRRALAVAAVSCAPNSIVLNLHRARGTLRVHYLDGTASKPSSITWPV